MRKFLLLMTLSFVAFVGNAQVICYVEAPSANEGDYEFTWADPAGGWGTADLTDPLNSVSGVMSFVTDGVDSLSCGTLTNDLTGKIAVLYRGSCEFGTKALNAQNAGAIGVIIINNLAGAPVGMGPGADGGSVNVPVVMISNVDGALLKAEIESESSTVFIGSKVGLYANDVGMSDDEYLRAESFAVNSILNTNDTEFEVEVGAWVRNYGTADQTDVTLNCEIINGTSLYNETSAPLSIPSGDSVYVTLPTFSQASYADGLYEMSYTIDMGPTDEADFDNGADCNFYFSDSLFSLSHVDVADGAPVQSTNQYNGYDLLETCLHFRDPNASRVGILGMTFSAGTSQNPDPTSLDGQFVEVYAYEWLDVFTDFNDYPDWMSANVNEIASGEYIYTSNIQSENVFVAFEETPVLVDDQRYLFCLNASTGLYPGYDMDVNYNGNFNQYLQPLNVMRGDFGQWFALGFGGDRAPAMTVRMFDSDGVSLVELPVEDFNAYPNPAQDFVTIPLGSDNGNANITVYDLAGNMISNQQVVGTGNGFVFDVTTIANGSYVVKVDFENEKTETFNIVVAR